MTLRHRIHTLLGLLAAVLALGCAVPAAAGAQGPMPHLQFLGQAILPTGTTFAGTEVGGLSSITYDAQRGVYYILSDDPSQIDPARFYTVRIDLGSGSFDAGDVHFDAVTTLKGPDGQPYPPQSLDPEGLVLTKDRRLVLTSEGFTDRLIDPFARLYALDGTMLGSLPVPQPFLPTADHSSGIRPNLAFESAGVPPSGNAFFTATENALYQDGPAATVSNGSPARILRYDLKRRTLERQWVYMTDAIAQAPVPSSAFAVNGLDELLPLNDQFLLAMERSFSVGVPGTGNSIKLYFAALPGATDVNGVESLAGRLDGIRPVRKTLLLDFDSLGIPLDNVEGMTLGPRLPDGRRSLVFVSDNNFAASQFTQFLLFALD
jgi:3-phytase/alkaline phosphatase D